MGKELPLYAKNLDYLLTKSKIKRNEFADSLGVSTNELGRILRGERNISADNQQYIAEMFQISKYNLINRDLKQLDDISDAINFYNFNPNEFSNNKTIGKMFEYMFVFFKKENNNKYNKYIKYLNNFFKSFILNPEMMEEIFSYFSEICEDEPSPEDCINFLNILLLVWLGFKNYQVDPDTTYIKSRVENYFNKKEEISEILEDFLNDYYDKVFELLRIVNDSPKYKDFVPYYLILKSAVNFSNKEYLSFDDASSFDYALSLFLELCDSGNYYANRLINFK